MDEICEHAGMPNKGWTYSGDDSSTVQIGGDDSSIDKVLEILYDPKTDKFKFRVKLNLKQADEYENVSEILIQSPGEINKIWDRVVLT